MAALLRRLTGVDIEECPVGRAGCMRIVAFFRPGRLQALALDTS